MKRIPLTKGVTGRWQDNIYNERRQGMPSLQVALAFGVAFGNRVAMVDTATLNRRATDAVSVGLGSPPAFPVRNQKSIGFSMLSPKPHAELFGAPKPTPTPMPTAVEIHKKTLKIVQFLLLSLAYFKKNCTFAA